MDSTMLHDGFRHKWRYFLNLTAYWLSCILRTLVNVHIGRQDLCAPTNALHPSAVSGRYNCSQQNAHSLFFNSAAERVTAQGSAFNSSKYELFKSIYQGDLATMRLVDSDGLDFRPAVDSPLRDAAVAVPPFTPAGNTTTDVGAYQYDEEGWRPGCTFLPQCEP
jgi:hypothetical protein